MIRKNKMIAVLLLLVMVLGSVSTTFAAEPRTQEKKSKKVITRDYYFEADDPSNLVYKEDQTIREGRKLYRATDVKTELFTQPLKVKKTIKSKDKEVPEYIETTFNGQTIRCYAPDSKKIKWEEPITVTKEYATEAEIPETIEDEGKTLTRKEVKPSQRWEKVQTVAYFYTTDPESAQFMFNDKKIMLKNGKPEWDGYLNDLAKYLGVNKNKSYRLTGTSWKGGFKEKDGVYQRAANVYGEKLVSYYTATYGLSGDDETYAANVTFTSKAIGHATVTYTRYLTTLQKVLYAGAGIALIIILTTLILFFLRRKRENEEAE